MVALLNEEREAHGPARGWFDSRFNESSPIVLPYEVALASVRLLANPKTTSKPILASLTHRALSDFGALDFIRFAPASAESWLLLGQLLPGITGFRAVHDAHLAALARTEAARLVTFDCGFSRYAGLDLEILPS